MLPPKLDYLFIAAFTDGTKYYQTPSDVSLTEPLTRSAFYDVLQRLPEVAIFTLTNGQREHTVFLANGLFKTDGRVIANPHGELTNYRLIYFRRMQQSVSGQYRHRPEVQAYFIGWQANDAKGRNFQMLLEIAPTGSVAAPVILK